jgi:hypothetical protein
MRARSCSASTPVVPPARSARVAPSTLRIRRSAWPRSSSCVHRGDRSCCTCTRFTWARGPSAAEQLRPVRPDLGRLPGTGSRLRLAPGHQRGQPGRVARHLGWLLPGARDALIGGVIAAKNEIRRTGAPVLTCRGQHVDVARSRERLRRGEGGAPHPLDVGGTGALEDVMDVTPGEHELPLAVPVRVVTPREQLPSDSCAKRSRTGCFQSASVLAHALMYASNLPSMMFSRR